MSILFPILNNHLNSLDREEGVLAMTHCNVGCINDDQRLFISDESRSLICDHINLIEDILSTFLPGLSLLLIIRLGHAVQIFNVILELEAPDNLLLF